MSMKHSVYRGGYPARNMQPDPESDIQEYSDFEDLDQGSEEETDEEEGEEDEDCEEEEDLEEEEDPALQLPYPGFIPISLKYLDQTSRPRNWCLRMITNPWFERISMLVILLNCVTLGMYQPCVDDKCITNRCKILQMFDDFIFVFFALEMTIKMIAMGCYGKGTYLADSWNRLDFFIVLAGALEYSMFMDNMNFTAIRTIRVLRPLRAINRIPSMRILVMLLLDTLPMLGNVLLLCFFVFFIFGIIGVQLWEGILRQRCFLKPLPNVTYPKNLPTYFQYKDQDKDYICSSPNDNGMHYCTDLPHYKLGDTVCNSTAKPSSNNIPTATDCVNWNQYYTECKSQGQNPFQGTISFDNIGLAWVAIFVVISLEGWVDIMYYVQDAHSFWDWIYFVLLIVIGSFFMINLCLVVIATQFSETKKREMERMKMERARYHSTSTLTSSTNNSEPNTCYAEMVKYVAHLYRRSKRRLIKKWRLYKYQRQLKREEKLAQSLPGAPSAAPPGVPVFDLRVQNNDIHADLSRKCTNNNNDSVSVDITSHTNNNNGNGGGGGLQIRVPSNSNMFPSNSNNSVNINNSHSNVVNSQSNVNTAPASATWEKDSEKSASSLLSPPTMGRRRSSVMFSDVILLRSNSTSSNNGGTNGHLAAGETKDSHHSLIPVPSGDSRNVCSSEKMTQAGDGNIWLPPHLDSQQQSGSGVVVTCQELLALSGALSAALPTGQPALHSLFSSLTKGVLSDWSQQACSGPSSQHNSEHGGGGSDQWADKQPDYRHHGVTELANPRPNVGQCALNLCHLARQGIRVMVNHKYFQQGILLAILINTLSMGIEYHNQPHELTVIVEISNVIFSAVFAFEMLLKVIAEGPFGYISNGFNVFDGVIVILSVIELGQTYFGDPLREGVQSNSGLSVLRTFRLLRILKLVRFMPNLRRQLFVMLRTMDNVAVFFSLLILFIFIFSILGMNLFGCKFCERDENGQGIEECDRKNFDSLLWALVTVFQILTQEDWNIVLFNGMEKTSHWAALYFVALMTFGNYVLFNLLVAILVEGFSAERNERREREARELEKQRRRKMSQCCSDEVYSSCSYSENSDSCVQDMECIQQIKDNGEKERLSRVKCKQKCNLHRDSDLVCQAPPIITHTAATPQDSPNGTLDRQHHPYNKLSLYQFPSSQSIESIDNSVSSQNSGPGLLRPPQHIGGNTNTGSNQSSGGGGTNNDQTGGHLAAKKKDQSSGTSKTTSGPGRGYSFKIKRSSSEKKRQGGGKGPSESGEEGDTVILNNTGVNTSSPVCRHGVDHSHCNGGLLAGTTIRNDTQCPTPTSRAGCTMRGLPTGGHPGYLPPQVSWVNRAQPVGGAPVPYKTSHENKSISTGPEGHITLPPSLDTPTSDHKINTSSASLDRASVGGGANLDTKKESITSDIPIVKVFYFFEQKGWLKEREEYALWVFEPSNEFRRSCEAFVNAKEFDNGVLVFIALNCITLAMERPNIPPDSIERTFLGTANYVFTFVFAVEMFVKVVSAGMFYGTEPYFKSGWNIMDGLLVIVSIIDLLMSIISDSSPKIFGILRVFRLLRSLRPLRVINRAPGLKLVVQTLLSSLRPIGNIVLICCTFFIIFGILGVQLFKGTFFYCDGPNVKHVRNRTDCLMDKRNQWVNHKYNFDDLGKALMSLFVLSSRDGWVNIMYTGLDAVGVDQQPIENYSEWRLLYFIAFILLVGFFVLNMFVGVVVENFHRCREEQEKEERVRRLAKRAKQMEKKRRQMHEPPYYSNYGKWRLLIHSVVTSKYFDLAIAAVIGLNVITMAMEFYMMPMALTYALKIFNYFFTAVFILECIMKLIALGFHIYLKDRWNGLDIGIVILSIVGIALEEVESKIIPINPTIIRVMRVLRIARVLKLLKMAKGIRALLDTVMQALPQVGNLGLLFFLLFFIFAALGVELFGRLECSDELPCQGLGEHAHFSNFGMAFLTLFRVATGDNWNGIMKDTLRDNCDERADCVRNCCVSAGIAPIFFVIFVLMAQFVLVNVVVAVLMKHLEESHKQMEDEQDMDEQLEREIAAAEAMAEDDEEEDLCLQLALQQDMSLHRPLAKVSSLPNDFTFTSLNSRAGSGDDYRRWSITSWNKIPDAKKKQRRQTLQGQSLIPPAYPALGCPAIYSSASPRRYNLLIPSEPRSGGAAGSTGVKRVKSDSLTGRRKSMRVQTRTSLPGGAVTQAEEVEVHEAPLSAKAGLSLTELIARPLNTTRRRFSMRATTGRSSDNVVNESLESPGALSEDISPDCVNPSLLLVPPPYVEVSEIPSYSLQPPSTTHIISETNVDLAGTSGGLPDLTQSSCSRILPDITSTAPSGVEGRHSHHQSSCRDTATPFSNESKQFSCKYKSSKDTFSCKDKSSKEQLGSKENKHFSCKDKLGKDTFSCKEPGLSRDGQFSEEVSHKDRKLKTSGRQQSMSDPSSINVNYKNNLDVRIHSDSFVNNT
uniref:Voltage-dependent T-type calcium channel subunit alpha-1G n=1 Tax=Cacopsylla melanoneura TaxID=428564 RepID=A0A8D9B9F1_9HEMI